MQMSDVQLAEFISQFFVPAGHPMFAHRVILWYELAKVAALRLGARREEAK